MHNNIKEVTLEIIEQEAVIDKDNGEERKQNDGASNSD